MQLIAMRLPHCLSGAAQLTVVEPQLFPPTVIGEQLKPMGTLSPVRSSPRRAATADAAVLVEETTLVQHWGELFGVVGGFVPVAAARATRAEVQMRESLENMFRGLERLRPRSIVKSYTKDLSLPIFELIIQRSHSSLF
jgi:hypothetical protein